MSVPIEIGTRGPERLQMSATGIYPLTISFEVDSTVVDRLVTFVERLPDGATSPEIEDPLPVAIVGSVDGKVTLRPDSTTAVDAGDRSAISDLLDAIDSLPGTPLNLALRPELVEGLTRSSAEDADLHNRLQFADSLSLLSTPYVHIEPGESADSDIADIFTGQLRQIGRAHV